MWTQPVHANDYVEATNRYGHEIDFEREAVKGKRTPYVYFVSVFGFADGHFYYEGFI
jgi:hypothetical protein